MPSNILSTIIFGLVILHATGSPLAARSPSPAPHPQVKTLKVTILSTMLADEGIGEWGFAALVESDGPVSGRA